jgi:hypothetical protein
MNTPKPGINAKLVAMESELARLRTENARLQEAKRTALRVNAIRCQPGLSAATTEKC